MSETRTRSKDGKDEDTHPTTGANAIVEPQRLAASVAYDISEDGNSRESRSHGQSRIRNFLQAIGLISDCGVATKG